MADSASTETTNTDTTTSAVTDTSVTQEDCGCDDKEGTESSDGTKRTKKPTWFIPPLGSIGTFSFKEPFNKLMFDNQEYEVKSLRSIKEVYDSEEDPYTNIYMEVELTENDFQRDLEWNVPIIVFTNTANQYYYVPATYLNSMAKISGIKYQERMMAINLGYLPLDFNIDMLKDIIVEDVKSVLGITSTVELIKTSGVAIVSEEAHSNFNKLLETNKTVKNSYKSRYNTLVNKYNLLQERMKLLHDCIEFHIEKNLPVVKDITKLYR